MDSNNNNTAMLDDGDMDEFVNWDHAAAAVGSSFDAAPATLAGPDGPDADLENLSLALEAVSEDNWGLSALQHFSEASFDMPGIPAPDFSMDPKDTEANTSTNHTLPKLYCEHPLIPCDSCSLGGYSCKKIWEGQYKGFCTSCVALSVDCSLVGASVPNTLTTEATTTLPSRRSLSGLSNGPSSTIREQLTNSPMPGMSSTLDFSHLASNSDNDSGILAPKPIAPPKIGARFSRESVRILKNWLNTHNRHPYPSEDEKEMLQRQTGLNKTQITNWLANARRRGKVQPPRPTSPQVGNWAGGMDIPQRRGTPALEIMNPLQRWEHSPPEHEPASVTAIARAVTASSSAVSSGLNSPFSYNYTDDGSGRSLCNQSSASSLGTSQSSGNSLQSAYSHGSRNSWASFGSAPFNNNNNGRRRRRRRRAATTKRADGTTSLAARPKTFQCTFCGDSFRSKHDWQRHEKSLHLSLERWVCTPEGPRAISPENGMPSCVFCGLERPSDEHIESHNHAACQERTLEERTFYRKDHLNQHLRLVHNVKFMESSMKSWKVATPEIRSRCGFCGIVMDTWTIRIDHLAEHFKTGYSMADWKGDWGFDAPVLDMVENSVPPYLIHNEQLSPLPFVASNSAPESPRNAYELIKLEMAYFGANHMDQHGREPTDGEMMVEGCRIIFASELLSLQGIATQASWLRDLIMKSADLSQKARFGPLRGAAENRLASLKINGKDNLFEACPMEFQLHEFVRAKRLLGLTAMDDELQNEACRIVGRVEEVSTHPSDPVANWLLRLVRTSTEWLAPFRRRAHLPRSEDVQDEIYRSKDPMSIDSTIHNYSRLERELGDFLKLQRSMGIEPSDEDLQRQARIVIYEFDDGWNQTAADNMEWLQAFKERHPIDGSPAASGNSSYSNAVHKSNQSVLSGRSTGVSSAYADPLSSRFGSQVQTKESSTAHGPNAFFLNDANCFTRLAKELGRWVSAAMSPNNPNRHVPTDAELQHQARWIIYDEDDPWNQTAADNAEWLQRFKRDKGIVNEDGPGLPDGLTWSLQQGGTGFAPPYAYPKGHIDRFADDVHVTMREASRVFSAHSATANNYLESLTSRYPQPATIFCSRELEAALVQQVQQTVAAKGCLPTDDAMRACAREVIGANVTAADDAVLLQKFKDWMRQKFPGAAAAPLDGEVGRMTANEPSMLPDMDLSLSNADLGNIMDGMTLDLGATAPEQQQQGQQLSNQDTVNVEQMDESGGVSLMGRSLSSGR